MAVSVTVAVVVTAVGIRPSRTTPSPDATTRGGRSRTRTGCDPEKGRGRAAGARNPTLTRCARPPTRRPTGSNQTRVAAGNGRVVATVPRPTRTVGTVGVDSVGQLRLPAVATGMILGMGGSLAGGWMMRVMKTCTTRRPAFPGVSLRRVGVTPVSAHGGAPDLTGHGNRR